LVWTLENSETINQTYEVGGAEYFTVRQVFEILMNITHNRKILVPLPPPWMRALLVMLDSFIPNFNISTYWLDYAAVNRTCPVDNLPRAFGLMPARFAYRLDYLARKPWLSDFMDRLQRTIRPTH
jgi:NADH dehydrogenase